MLDIHGSLQLLNSSRLCFAASWLGGVWNGFLLGREVLPCRFCGALDHDGHLFW